jgi:hypothetical protein
VWRSYRKMAPPFLSRGAHVAAGDQSEDHGPALAQRRAPAAQGMAPRCRSSVLNACRRRGMLARLGPVPQPGAEAGEGWPARGVAPFSFRAWIRREDRGPVRLRRRAATAAPLRHDFCYASRMRWGIAAFVLMAAPALAQSSADERDRRAMIAESIRTYSGNCPCPYNTDRAGRSCGQRSAWSKPGGAAPLCYPRDITDAMLERWRSRQP